MQKTHTKRLPLVKKRKFSDGARERQASWAMSTDTPA
jgi:hypothetical protein